MRLWLLATVISGLAVLPRSAAAVRTMIPKTCFDSQAAFDADWVYNYPWGGTDHNGAARMAKSQVKISGGVLTITATKVSGQKPARHAGKDIAIKYLSGAIGAKEHFNVSRSGGYDFSGEFKATVARGTWPAFWLSGVDSWPPEIDMAEWKGSGKISFNTFNTSSQVKATDVTYPDPGSYHKIRCEVRDVDGRDVSIKFFMDDKLVTTQAGKGFVGKPMYL
jgi:galactan endo-beta-1,3-galactanase